MIKEVINIYGKMKAVLTKPDGIIEITEVDNIIVNDGFDFICDAIGKASSRPSVMSMIDVGTGATTPVVDDSDLQASILAKAATYAHMAGTKSFTLTSTFAAGEATGAIVEAGVKNTDDTPVLMDRVTFGVINKEANDAITMTFTFTFA